MARNVKDNSNQAMEPPQTLIVKVNHNENAYINTNARIHRELYQIEEKKFLAIGFHHLD